MSEFLEGDYEDEQLTRLGVELSGDIDIDNGTLAWLAAGALVVFLGVVAWGLLR